MPSFLDRLPPNQRQLLVIGVPVVAALVVVNALRGRQQPAGNTPPANVMPAQSIANLDAIGVGQLAAYESSMTEGLVGVQMALAELLDRPSNTPTLPPAAPAPATPSAPVTVAPGGGSGTPPAPGFFTDFADPALTNALLHPVAGQSIWIGAPPGAAPAGVLGPYVAPEHRLPGERYDASGRVVL